MNTTYTPKQYVCIGAHGMIADHTVYTLTQALEDQRYDNDRAAISKLEVGEMHTDVDDDIWERVS